jgi:hypothetical protein
MAPFLKAAALCALFLFTWQTSRGTAPKQSISMTNPEVVKMLLERTKRSENDSSGPRVIKIGSESDSYI